MICACSLLKLVKITITFNDRMKYRIMRKGAIQIEGIFRLDDFLFFLKLKPYLKNFSQIYEKDYRVEFTNNNTIITILKVSI